VSDAKTLEMPPMTQIPTHAHLKWSGILPEAEHKIGGKKHSCKFEGQQP
jgi:hypothetical protein